MNDRSMTDEHSSLMYLDANETHLQLSPSHSEDPLRVVSNLEPEPGDDFSRSKERTRCKIKVRIHHLDADQTHRLQQLLEQFAADASPELDVELSMTQHQCPGCKENRLTLLAQRANGNHMATVAQRTVVTREEVHKAMAV